MQLYSVIKNDGPGDVLAWKFLGEDFNSGSQLIVAESEEALFFKDGIIEQIFDGGKYTLGTNNYPFLSRFRNFFSGGVSAFNCKVYFINKVHKLELFWGTDTPIQMRDPVHKLQTNIVARGSYTIQVINSKKFLIKLIGNNIQYFTQEELNHYFRSAFLQYIKDEIPRVIQESGREILDICTEKTKIAESLTPKLNEILDEYGVRLVNFYISAIEIPPNDPNRAILEQAQASALAMGITAQAAAMAKITNAQADKGVFSVLGDDWGRQQSAEILRDLANNPGAGGVAAAGAGLGMGMAAGSVFGDLAAQMFTPMAKHSVQPQPLVQSESRFTQRNQVQSSPKTECPSCRTENIQGTKFCSECGNKLVAEKVNCRNCGAEIPDTAKFCNECGTRRM